MMIWIAICAALMIGMLIFSFSDFKREVNLDSSILRGQRFKLCVDSLPKEPRTTVDMFGKPFGGRGVFISDEDTRRRTL